MATNVIRRRKFLLNSGMSTAAILLGNTLTGFAIDERIKTRDNAQTYDIMKEVRKYQKIDAHAHINIGHGGIEEQIDNADRLGITKLIISRPLVTGKGTPKEFVESNNMVLDAMKRYPKRVIGQMTLNVIYQKESLEEIKRCVDLGMVGLKVYNQVKINDSLFYPIIEKFIDLKMIILMHAFCQLGLAGYRMKYDIGVAPETSIPEDFVDIAKRYPEAMFQFAHIAGGGDWEYECKMFKNYPNIYVGTAGSNNEENIVDFAVKCLGEDRVIYGSDSCYYQGVGKILSSGLSEGQKRKIFFENYKNILKRGGNDVN